MAKTVEELEKMFSEMQESQAKSEKEFKQQIEMAQRDTRQYKEMAEKNAEELRAFKQEAETKEKQHKEALEQSRQKDISEFVEAQTKAGRILPAFKEKMITFMKSLTSESSVMEFTEKDGSKRSHNQISLFKEIISKMKPVISLDSELTPGYTGGADLPDGDVENVETFAEVLSNGQKRKLPVAGIDLAQKANEYQSLMAKNGKSVSYDEALIFVSTKK